MWLVQGTLKVSAEVFEGMDPEDVSAIPKAFDIRFEEPMGHRVFTEGPDGTCVRSMCHYFSLLCRR